MRQISIHDVWSAPDRISIGHWSEIDYLAHAMWTTKPELPNLKLVEAYFFLHYFAPKEGGYSFDQIGADRKANISGQMMTIYISFILSFYNTHKVLLWTPAQVIHRLLNMHSLTVAYSGI